MTDPASSPSHPTPNLLPGLPNDHTLIRLDGTVLTFTPESIFQSQPTEFVVQCLERKKDVLRLVDENGLKGEIPKALIEEAGIPVDFYFTTLSADLYEAAFATALQRVRAYHFSCQQDLLAKNLPHWLKDQESLCANAETYLIPVPTGSVTSGAVPLGALLETWTLESSPLVSPDPFTEEASYLHWQKTCPLNRQSSWNGYHSQRQTIGQMDPSDPQAETYLATLVQQFSLPGKISQRNLYHLAQ